MNTLINYLRWRGDITMLERPFNDIDNVILSMVVYVDFSVVRSKIRCKSKMLLTEAIIQLLEKGYTSKCLMEVEPEFLLAISESKRFEKIYISDFRDIYDKKRNCQFAAIKFTLEDGTAYIAFRGTDKTIVGWRENFMMSFKVTDAQLEAVSYINDVLAQEDIDYRIGGHSKGGHLAVYSSAHCSPEIQDKIIEIYDNDGPGICKEITKDNLLENIKNRIRRIVPEYSVVGMLFELDIPFNIVKSSEKGINQHNAFSWQLEGDRFITSKELSPQARHLNHILDRWMEREDMEHREVFVNQVFNAIEASGADELSDITGGLNSIERVVTEILYSEKKTKKVFHHLISTILESTKKISIVELLHKRESLLSMLMIVFGMLLFVIPGAGFQILGTGFIFGVTVFSALRLGYHLKANIKYRSKTFYVSLIYLLCILLLILLAFHVNELKLLINFLFGISAFMFGLIKLKRILKNRIRNVTGTKLVWIQCASAIIVGLAVLRIPYYYVEDYLYIIGLYIIILGFTELIYQVISERSIG